jgi:RimJ/RimL family protein N-acetyltransferase
VDTSGQWAELAFVVDEAYQNIGISTFVFKLLAELAKQKGLKGFYADVLLSNSGMMKVFRKSGLPILADKENGVMHVSILLNQ